MSRTTILVLVALGAALAGFTLSTNARRVQDDPPAPRQRAAAIPQKVTLDWREAYGPEGQKLVFSVDALEVLPDGWRARVGLENETSVPYEVTGPGSSLNHPFGLMLFESGELAELERLNESNALPAARPATRYEPSLPVVLEPGDSWAGTISAPGALVADSWVRVQFPAVVSVGTPPEELDEVIGWITDHTYHLRG
jgi:hypothetical protein